MNFKTDLKQLEIDPTQFEAALSHVILKAYLSLRKVILTLSYSLRDSKKIEGTGGKVSVSDLLAYQIGWGKALIRWYEAGIKQELPEITQDRFSKLFDINFFFNVCVVVFT